jgi:biopolymer transport protein ExbD
MKIDVQRPSAASATRASTKAIRVHIERGGGIFVEGLPVKSWMVQTRIRDLLKAAPRRPVLVVTDRNIAAERLIEVVDQCRLAGAPDVGVATEAEAG